MKTQTEEVIDLLQKLITLESFSKTENQTADEIWHFLIKKGLKPKRYLNNVWVLNKYYDTNKPTLLLNSHHDTVKPADTYTRNPYDAKIENGKLFGLGSNDAGASLVALLACFLYFYNKPDLQFNVIFAASAEEEISGKNGIEALLPELGIIYLGIVGEPTKMNMAVAEKGLLVLDCVATGITGHAAHNEGDNALYKAIKDIEWFQTYTFPQESEWLGPVKMSVTMIEAGSQHNVIPATCKFTVDIRTTDLYPNQLVLDHIRQHVSCSIQPRSTRLQASSLSPNHRVAKAAAAIGIKLVGSPTTSDQALMPFDTCKIGPGDSERSHRADEFIFIHEIEEGIQLYIQLLNKLNESL